MNELKTFKDILFHLKSKYNEVRIYKELKRHNVVVRIFKVKNKRELYYIATFDKKGNIRIVDNKVLKIVPKDDLQNRIRNFKKLVYDLEMQERIKRNTINSNEVLKYSKNKKNGKSYKNKKAKEAKIVGLKFKGKKLDDLVYLWGLLRLTLTYADEAKNNKDEKLFEFQKSDAGYLRLVTKSDELDNKFIVELYYKLSQIFRQNGVFDGTLEADYLDKMFEKHYKQSADKLKQKNNSKNVYYIDIYLVLYLVQLWREDVKFKSVALSLDYDLLFKIIEIVYSRYESDENVLENTEFFVEELYHLAYKNKGYKWFMKLHK